MKTIEVQAYQQDGEYFMKVTKFPKDHEPVSSHHRVEVNTESELLDSLTEYQTQMNHYGIRVIILKGEN